MLITLYTKFAKFPYNPKSRDCIFVIPKSRNWNSLLMTLENSQKPNIENMLHNVNPILFIIKTFPISVQNEMVLRKKDMPTVAVFPDMSVK